LAILSVPPARRAAPLRLMMPIAIVAYLALFASVGFLFLFASLFLGRFLRPHSPTPLKLDIYECGEPAVGPSNVQFDLRFYVVALVFLVFEVEVALFFPTATIFGKAAQVLDPNFAITTPDTARVPDNKAQTANKTTTLDGSSSKLERISSQLSPAVAQKYADLGVPASAMPFSQFLHSGSPSSHGGKSSSEISEEVKSEFQSLALTSMLDLGLFFAVLLVGFAFVWSRGDLDWVRAVRHLPTPAETIALAQRLRSDMAR
jgi:NADH-quinone oxidoreductase subunit A